MTPRSATQTDLPAIAALHAANWRRDCANVLSATTLGAPLAQQIACLWGEGGAFDAGWQVWVIFSSGRSLRGFVLYRVEAEAMGIDALHIGALHVAADHRWRGVGTALMHHVGKAAQDRPIWLEVLAGNDRARAIYRRWGGRDSAPFVESFLGQKVESLRVDWAGGSRLLAALGGSSRS
jgi:ribosomal protein S18 acetylase RimI-like enzyme